jgi:hypothetical protein
MVTRLLIAIEPVDGWWEPATRRTGESLRQKSAGSKHTTNTGGETDKHSPCSSCSVGQQSGFDAEAVRGRSLSDRIGQGSPPKFIQLLYRRESSSLPSPTCTASCEPAGSVVWGPGRATALAPRLGADSVSRHGGNS